jgi:pyruvate,phosphate dikinase
MGVTIKVKAATPEPIRIFKFGSVNDGNASMKDVLGGKGANLAEMARQGLPVPPGFTLPTTVSTRYQQVKNLPARLDEYVDNVWIEVAKGLEYLTAEFGHTPLLSVRSGARVSMPGMMDTILNVGITTETFPYWEKKLGRRTALDCYRRLIQMYASVAMDKDLHLFENALVEMRKERGVKFDHQLDEAALERLVSRYKKIAGPAFPDTLDGQLKGAIIAVFQSWMNPRAVEYRAIHGYSEEWGTAVNVQAMVFGNLNDKSGTGVCFTRDRNTGQNVLWGDFLINGQGEDVVAGIRDADMKVSEIGKWNAEVYKQLRTMANKLEALYRDMQDTEFTVQDGKLWMLQTRGGKRSALAAFVIAHDMALEGLITKDEAIKRVSNDLLLASMTDEVDPSYKEPADLTGTGAGGGVVRGKAVFTPSDAINCNEPSILVAKQTDPDDIAGMKAAIGILTQTGGITSHAAVVARGWDKTCVVGCTALDIAKLKAKKVCYLTIDGTTGKVWINKDVPVVKASAHPAIKEVCSWAAGSQVVERVEFPLAPNENEIIELAKKLTGVVHIDTCLLESSTGKCFSQMAALGKALAQSKVTRVYVDFRTMRQMLGKSDLALMWMVGERALLDYVNTVDLENKMKAVAEWPAAVLVKTIVAGGHLGPDPKLVAALQAKGVSVMGKVRTFADLMASDGVFDVDQTTYLNFGGEEAFKKALQMIEEKLGKKLSGKKPVPLYWYEFLNHPKEAA